MAVTPMFPLGTVLIPGGAIPLEIFEPRYQRLLHDVQADDGTFGIVLIERGHEVGGGDSRFGVGTLAHISEHRPLGDGRHELVVHGIRRIRVEEWLDDAPYPRAHVTPWPDETDHDPAATRRAYRDTVATLRRFLALAAELGHPVAPATFTAPDDPGFGSHLLTAYAPVGPLDRQRLLEAPGPLARLAVLDDLLDGMFELFSVD